MGLKKIKRTGVVRDAGNDEETNIGAVSRILEFAGGYIASS